MFTDGKKLSPAQRYREMIREFEYFKKYQCDITFRECLEFEYEKKKIGYQISSRKKHQN